MSYPFLSKWHGFRSKWKSSHSVNSQYKSETTAEDLHNYESWSFSLYFSLLLILFFHCAHVPGLSPSPSLSLDVLLNVCEYIYLFAVGEYFWMLLYVCLFVQKNIFLRTTFGSSSLFHRRIQHYL